VELNAVEAAEAGRHERGGLRRVGLEILPALLAHGEGFPEAGGDLADLGGGGRIELYEQRPEVIDREISGGEEGLQTIALGAEPRPTRLVRALHRREIVCLVAHKKSDLGVD
jgi:hypothetical protein